MISFIITIFRWYFGNIDRLRAEVYLKLPEYGSGAFLVRKSERRNDAYALSVKYQFPDDLHFIYKHYRIIALHKPKDAVEYQIKGVHKR